jgi:hypothetical protein
MPITFILNIEEPRGRSVTRNLTRGVNATSDIPVPTPTPTPPRDQEISLQTLLLSLSVSSEFVSQNVEVPLSSVVVDLTNLISLSNGLVVTDDEFLSLTLLEPTFTAPVSVPLSSINVELTIPQVGTVATGNQSKELDNLVIDLSLEEFKVEFGGNLDVPGIELTIPAIEVRAASNINLSPVIIDLSLDIEVDGDVSKALDQIDVNLASNIGIEVVDNTPGMIVALTVPQIEVRTGNLKALDTLNVNLAVEEFEVEVGGNLDVPGLSLTVPAESLDVGLNIQLPADMESAQDDDTTVIV